MKTAIRIAGLLSLCLCLGAKKQQTISASFPIASGGGGSITLDKSNYSNTCSSGCTSATVSLTGQAANSGIIIGIRLCANSGCAGSAISNPITSVGNGMDANLVYRSDTFSGPNQYSVVYSGTTTSGGNLTYTVNFNTTIYDVRLLASSWNNLGAVDQSGSSPFGFYGGAPYNITTSGNLAQSNELIYSVAATGAPPVAGTGFTIINSVSGDSTGDEYQVGGTSGATATASWGSAASPGFGNVVTFK